MRKQMDVIYVNTKEQLADLMTKALLRGTIQRFEAYAALQQLQTERVGVSSLFSIEFALR